MAKREENNKLEKVEKRGNIAFFSTYRSPVPLDIFSCPIPKSMTFREISIAKSLLEETRLIKLLEVDGCIAIFQIVGNFEVKLWIFNGNWSEEIISIPLDWDRYGLQQSIHIPSTDIIILKARRTHDAPTDLVSIYHYDRKKKTFEKVEILGLPALMMRPLGRIKTMRTMDYDFFTMFESLAPVQKQQQYN